MRLWIILDSHCGRRFRSGESRYWHCVCWERWRGNSPLNNFPTKPNTAKQFRYESSPWLLFLSLIPQDRTARPCGTQIQRGFLQKSLHKARDYPDQPMLSAEYSVFHSYPKTHTVIFLLSKGERCECAFEQRRSVHDGTVMHHLDVGYPTHKLHKSLTVLEQQNCIGLAQPPRKQVRNP